MGRVYRGVLSYRQDGAVIGRETFVTTVHADGSRTIRCLCEMDTFSLLRDVTYTINAAFEAVDCFVRVINENVFVGSGWFNFTEDYAEGESFTALEGRVTQRVRTPGRTKLFGSHPISMDILKCAHTPAERPGEVQPLINCFSSSLIPNGAGGPTLTAKTYDMTYVGPVKKTVRAGTFACLNYQWNTHTGRTLDMFTVPGDWLPVLTIVPERGREFELVEFEELSPAAAVIA